MGGKIDHGKNSGGAPYCFSLSGTAYHSIGSLLPKEGARPVYSQLYVYDTDNEVQNRINAVSKHSEAKSIDPAIVEDIKKELDLFNPYVQHYRCAANRIRQEKLPLVKLCLLSSRNHDGRIFNTPTASEISALIVGDIDMNFIVRDIIVEHKSGKPKRISELHASYLPLQYPLLFPYGEDGYRDDIEHSEESLCTTKKKKRLSIREFFAFRLMTRDDEISILLHADRLLQQFIVDGYAMVEAQRLHWYKTHQKELRADLYQGLADAVFHGEHAAAATGKRIILPATFTGGARYMIQNYQDAMAICRWAGYPDLFLTFTCNSGWPEIDRFVKKYNVKANNRPEVLSRVFRMKLLSLMKILKDDKIFGEVRAEVYTIEFQKRGLPHAHILLFLEEPDKIRNVEHIDQFISAEIPDESTNPRLFNLVKNFMIHGPCGQQFPNSPCMKKKKECSKKFPKKFCQRTEVDSEGFPTNRRRNDGRTIEIKKDIYLDNRYVVPYNATLLQLFEAHINIEKCNQSMAIKYLFKYISKGHDRVVAGIFSVTDTGPVKPLKDEIQQYYNCRYISACEGAWRLLGFDIHHRKPSVEWLSFHLPNQQYVIYNGNDDVADVVEKPRVKESQFLSWMKMNASGHEEAVKLTYAEFPKKFVYDRKKREWRERKSGMSVGRLANASPNSGELYFLRILLTKIRGPTCFDDIRKVNGVAYESFKDACEALGFLDDDIEFVNAIREAAEWSSGHSLRKLFAIMILSNTLQKPELVWDRCRNLLSEDMFYAPHARGIHSDIVSDEVKQHVALVEIDKLLQLNGRHISEIVGMPSINTCDIVDYTNSLILQELSYDRPALRKLAASILSTLTDEQTSIYETIMRYVGTSLPGFFFVHGYGGTGKTYLWNALASSLRGSGDIVLTVASSGIAATLLPSGRTAHSRFAIPIVIAENSCCSITQKSPLAELLVAAKLIIWDEAPMIQRYCVEAFDRSLRDIMQCNEIFGGKCVVMGGDFRQILPVIPHGTRASIVFATICSSYLWEFCQVFHLTRNMRISGGTTVEEANRIKWFTNWLLDLGDGKLGEPEDGVADVEIPDQLLVPYSEDPLGAIANATYPDLLSNLSNNIYFNDRAILAPTIKMVGQINSYMCSLLPGEEYQFLSCDSVCRSSEDTDSVDNLYTHEFLNTIESSGLPSHVLTLKIGVPVILLRNIVQSVGLCNGTRLRITRVGKNVLEGITLNGSHPNEKVLIHRMNLNPSENKLPFRMRRRQFPVNLCFAMTINKSQGQSLKHVGLYLEKPVFTHGQLYVACSRVRSVDGLKIFIPSTNGTLERKTKNVVYNEVLSKVYNKV